MTKLIDSLCGVRALDKRNRIQDSYNDVSPDKIAKAKRYVEEEADRPEDALYVVMDYLYDSPVAIDTDRDVVDVEAKGYHWPNGDAFRSSVVKVNEPGVAMTSLWGSGNPRDLWFIPLPVAEICEIDDPKVTPGYYYLNAETNTIDRIGSTEEDLNKWMRSLDTDETIEAQKRNFARKEQLRRDERRMSAETSRENVEDSLQGDKENRSKVLAELKELRKSVSDDKIVEALAYYMSNADVTKFVDMVRKFHGVKPPVSDSYDDEYRQFDRFNDLREEVSDKEIVDVLPSYMGGYEINKFVDKVRNFYGLDQNPNEDTEDSARQGIADSVTKFKVSPKDVEAVRKSFEEAGTPLKESNAWFYAEAPKERVVELLQDYEYEIEDSTSKVSDAAYNPKFEKLRRVLSDTTIVEELSHYMSSDELEEFTETLTRNYDIDLEEVEDSAK